ncbi:MAG: ABC transporter permease [Ignavibacteriales bacterium]|nr:MAG: ABC transporter permease [Ignavibacteriales bacterium]
MFKNYFKIALRNLKRDKTYSLINIFGLSVGMTAFILVALLLQFLYSFDEFHPDYERIFRVQQEIQDEHKTEWTQTVYPLANELKNNFPEIKDAAVIREIWSEYLSSKNDLVVKDLNGFLADPEILKILSFKFIEGNPVTALTQPGSVVLTKTLAQKLFPDEKAFGKMIRGSFTKDLIVTGIIEDYPLNSHIRPSYLVSFSTMDNVWGRDYKGYRSDWHNNAYRNYILLKENTDAALVESKIKNLLYKKIDNNNSKLYLKRIDEALINATREAMSNSPIPYYAAIALFILILACINFINLTTARSGLREREIGIRKVVGGSRWSLIKQFTGESVLISFPAMVLAFLFAKAYLPVFNTYMETQLEISITGNWQFVLLMIILFLLVGMLAGLYPSFYLSSLKPVAVIKGNHFSSKSGKANKGMLRKILVAFQFIISITLILSTVFMFKQVDFMKHKDLGYNKTNLLRCYIEAGESKSTFAELQSRLMSNPSIINACVSENTPAHGTSGTEIRWEGGTEDQYIYGLINRIDHNFISTFQMKIVKGRNFSKEFSTDSSACLINETLASAIGWSNPIGKKINNRYTVIGVIKDFHPVSVHNRISPYLALLHNGKLNHENDYCVRISPNDISNSMQFVRNILKSFFPNNIFEVQLYDTNFDKGTMAVWEGVKSTFGFFSALAIIIALIGLLGLVSFSTRRRTKEIGIRKVLGASESGLYLLVSKEFLMLLVFAIILAAPLAYIVLVTAPGAYKYQVTTMDFLIPLMAIVAVTILVTLKQVLSVTKANPSDSLHYE